MSNNLKFGYNNSNDVFVNLYTKDNPILQDNDECYFMLNSVNNIHLYTICTGIVRHNIFNDGMHKTYYIELTGFVEGKIMLDKYFYGNRYILYRYNINSDNNKIGQSKHYFITEKTEKKFFQKNLFKIDCFFVRQSLVEILTLRQEYSLIMKKILERQIEDLQPFLSTI